MNPENEAKLSRFFWDPTARRRTGGRPGAIASCMRMAMERSISSRVS